MAAEHEERSGKSPDPQSQASGEDQAASSPSDEDVENGGTLPIPAQDQRSERTFEFFFSKAMELAGDVAPDVLDYRAQTMAKKSEERRIELEGEQARLDHEQAVLVTEQAREQARLEHDRAVRLSEQERELTLHIYRTPRTVASIEAWLRVALAGALVAGTITIVVVGMAMGTSPERLAQYLAPITALAGLAVGYVLGAHAPSRASAGPKSPEERYIVTGDEQIHKVTV